jgi:hypothetical protein
VVPVQLNAVNDVQGDVGLTSADRHELEQSLALERTISQLAPVAVVEGQLHVHVAG